MIKIIEYRDEFKKEVSDLIVSIFVDEYGFEHYRESCTNADYNKYKKTDGNCWIALSSDGKVIGSIALEGTGPDEAYLKIMYVNGNYRGEGIAQKLYDKLYEFARKKGYKRIILGTYERLGRAIGFYLKNGFTECPHETYTYDDVYYSVDIESPIQKKYVPTTHLNKYSLVKAAV